MESETRPHRTKSNSSSSNSATSTTASELFICFTTSRLCSSMKLSSKSLLSPGRARDPTTTTTSQISLSSSVSRRLRSSGSIKGGASPMFPSNGGGPTKKRGCAFENPEPSSPKVTCIGQVRVKTKKQGKKMRIIARSKRSREASFRKAEQNHQGNPQSQELSNVNNNNNFQGSNFLHQQINSHHNNQQECLRQRNQRWVHLPLTICEALRAFGSEFNCLFPTRSSSCLAGENDNANHKEKEEESKGMRSESGGGGSTSSCGAVFARWFVALQDGEGKGRDIELVVGEDGERAERCSEGSGGHSQRRQVFEGIEFKEERDNEGLVEEGGGRVSVCVPPKNALLLMRCRSDPVKMAALANRFWEIPAAKNEEGKEENEDEGLEEEAAQEEEGLAEKAAHKEEGGEQVQKLEIGLEDVKQENDGDEDEHGGFEEVEDFVLEQEDGKDGLDENREKRQQLYDEEQEIEAKDDECQQENEEEEDVTQKALPEDCCQMEVVADPDGLELEKDGYECEASHEEEKDEDDEEEEEVREEKPPMPSMESVQSEELEEQEEIEGKTEDEVAEDSNEEVKTETVNQDSRGPKNPVTCLVSGSNRAGQNPILPDCLLLMMCEPKLSMEVSKETWVCSTDFIRCLPERHVKKVDGPDETKKRVSVDSKPPLAPAAAAAQPVIQPPRSSCSFPIQAGPVSMAAMIGQKLVGSAAYEPFVLTRCKSEPMRSAGKLAAAPETCFWKNRKMEPHGRAAMGVGAAGVGF